MIEIQNHALRVSFPEVHPSAAISLGFQRTLRLPDNAETYYLPPGLGRFPLQHIDDFAGNLPPSWLARGGVIMPMYQAEALWINFDTERDQERRASYPMAIKIGAGKINAITGNRWRDGLNRKGKQNFVVAPKQPWLDGYYAEEGVVRQFVAMPLGEGYTAEEQLTGKADVGGLQIEVFPMKREAFEQHFPVKPPSAYEEGVFYCFSPNSPMGLAPGGRIKQSIAESPYPWSDWDLDHSSRCFVHLVNSLTWQTITGSPPPHPPLTASDYEQHALPWFDWYDENSQPIKAQTKLAGLSSVATLAQTQSSMPPSGNHPMKQTRVITLGPGNPSRPVREIPSKKTAPPGSPVMSRPPVQLEFGYGSREIKTLADLDQRLATETDPVVLVEGIRALPDHHIEPLRSFGSMLATRYPQTRFRSGNAPGSDAAFAEGVSRIDPTRLQIVLPYTGHRKSYVQTGASLYALDGLPQAAEDRISVATSRIGRDVGRLAKLYTASGRTTSAGTKAAYLLRDTMKVLGAPEIGLPPVTVGIFYVNEADPLAGGTGHTVKVCAYHQIPVVFQEIWMDWPTPHSRQ
ncbi:MAG TPA: hypothetical protein PKE55_07155 [Kiritimatiellia bacterium]|nr:hypothetical protein [Kiritimatiellia bacterium]